MMRWPTSGAAGVVPTSTVSHDGSKSKLFGLPPRGNQSGKGRCEKVARRFGAPESYPPQMLDRAGAYYGLCSRGDPWGIGYFVDPGSGRTL